MKARAKVVAILIGYFCGVILVSQFVEVPEVRAQEKAEIRQYLDLGVKLYAQGRYRDALEQFTRVLLVEPDNKIAKRYKEECTEYLAPSVAEEITVEYPEEAPPPPTPVGPSPEEVRRRTVEKYLELGQEYYDNEQYERAIDEWQRVLLVEPTNERAIESIRVATVRQTKKERETIRRDLKVRGETDALAIEGKLKRPGGTNIDGIKEYRVTFPAIPEEKKPRPVEAKMEEVRKKLEQLVSVNFAEGTDVRDVLEFLSDWVEVNIMIDERVMLAPIGAEVAAEAVGRPQVSPMGMGTGGPMGMMMGMPAPSGRGGQPSPGGQAVTGGVIAPSVPSEIRRLYLKDIPLAAALQAMLRQMGLDYKIQPDFIWISRPDILRQESFEDLETRYYLLQNAGGESLPKVAMVNPGGGFGGGGYGGGGGGYGGGGGTGGGGFGGGGTGGGGYGGTGGGGYGGTGGGGGGYGGTGGGGGGYGGTGGGGGRGGGGYGGTGGGGGGYGGGGGGASFSNIMELFIGVDHYLVGEVEPVIGIGGVTGYGGGGRGGGGGQYGGTGASQFGGGGLGGGAGGYGAQGQPAAIEILYILQMIVPDIIEPYTGRVLSYMDFSPTTNLLIIHNTPSNFEIIESMIEHLDLTPRQVHIESKFLTIDLSDMEKLGFSYGGKLSGEGYATGTAETETTAETDEGTTTTTTTEVVTAFQNQVEAVADALVSGGDWGSNFTISGIIDKASGGDLAQATMEFFSRLEHTELLSAPKVVALNRKPAMIADVRQDWYDAYRYTEVFPTLGTANTVSYSIVETVEPSPWMFGITLSVTAQIGKGEQIRLWLNPQVIDLIETKEFVQTSTYPTAEGPQTVTSRTHLPVTSLKAVWSNVIVNNGDTLVLGGLVTDEHIYRTDKLPWLSDLPLIGRLFTGTGESKKQRSLLIFVTPTLIDTTGAKFFEQDQGFD